MDIQTLKLILESKFELVCFYDLADSMSEHGKIFKIFKNHYRSEYLPTQRLGFYTAEKPSQLVLNHLQRAATSIDISNYFITICTPHDIKTSLDLANKKYGNDSVTMQWHPCELQSTKNIDSSNIYSFDTFCTLPFGFLSVDASSNLVQPCCKYSSNLGSLDSDNMPSLFNNVKMSQLRNDIKHGRRHKDCKNCWEIEDLGNVSMRKLFINKFSRQCDQEWVDNPKIRDLTISPSNLCNFKCRICSPETSSKIAVEELKFSTDQKEQQKLKKIISILTQNNRTVEQIFEITSDLQFLHVLGGEPFLWPELDELVSKLVDTGLAKNIQIEFNTNGSVFPAQIVEKLLEFKSVGIVISIDDIGDRFELQRGGNWNQVLQNILAFSQLKSSNFVVKIFPTVNIQNLLYLDQLAEFCRSNDLDIVWWFLENPECLCIDFVTSTTKDIVFKKYINHPDAELQAIAKRMKLSAPTDGSSFLSYMKKLDQRRGQDSSVVLKEIFDAMSH
jgi:organic radical activating enzyme